MNLNYRLGPCPSLIFLMFIVGGKEEGLAELWAETGKKVTADIDTANTYLGLKDTDCIDFCLKCTYFIINLFSSKMQTAHIFVTKIQRTHICGFIFSVLFSSGKPRTRPKPTKNNCF